MLVANRLVTTFRSPFLGMTAQERARRSTANVDQALDKGGAGRVSSKVSPQGHLVFVDDSMVIILTPQDVDPLSQDTLDAMTMNRPYRKALPYDRAREEVIKFGGVQFDPRVVEAFLQVPEPEWEGIRKQIKAELTARGMAHRY